MLSKNLMKLGAIFMILAMIFSMLAFMSNYVYAAPSDMWDLTNFVESASMTDINGTPIGPNDTTYIGESYIFNINFTESPVRQLSYSGSPIGNALLFQLPSQLQVQTAVSSAPITLTNGVTVGSYSIDLSGLVTVRFNEVNNAGTPTPGTNFVDNYTNVDFWLNITAQLMASGDSNIDFGNGEEVVVTPPVTPPPSLQVVKTSKLDNPTAPNRIEYIITITALGSTVTGITLSDTPSISGTGFTNITTPNNPFYGFMYDVNNSGRYMPMAVTWSGDEFSFDFAGLILNANDFITVRYSMDIPTVLANNNMQNAVSYNFNVGNNATAKGDDVPPNTNTPPNINITQSLEITKSGVIGGPVNGKYYIEWTVQVGPTNPAVPLNERVIADQLSSGLNFVDPAFTAPGTSSTDAMNNINIELFDQTGNSLWYGTPNLINETLPPTSSMVTPPYFTINSANNGFNFTIPPSGADYPDGLTTPVAASLQLDSAVSQHESSQTEEERNYEMIEIPALDVPEDDLSTTDNPIDKETTESEPALELVDEAEVDKPQIYSAMATDDEDDSADDALQADDEPLGSDGRIGIVATDIELGDIYSVTITFRTQIDEPPPLIPGRPPSATYQNTIGIDGGNNKTATVQVRPPALNVNKQTSGICGNSRSGVYYIDYEIDFIIPKGNGYQTFYIFDTLAKMPGNTQTTNVPVGMNVTFTDVDTNNSIAVDYAFLQNNQNQWSVYFGTKVTDGLNLWPSTLSDVDVLVTMSYRIVLSPDAITFMQNGNTNMIQNTVNLVNGPTGSTPGQGIAVSVGGRNVNDYWPIFKSAQYTNNPALFNYTVTINNAYSGRGYAFLANADSSAKNPIFSDMFDSRLSYVPGTFYMRNSSTGAIYAPPPGSDVSVSGSSFNTYLRSLVQYNAPPALGGTVINASPPTAWFSTKSQNLEAHYQLTVRNQYLETVQIDMSNSATIEVNPGECTFNSTTEVNYNPQQINKTVTTDGSDMAHVEIVINPDGGFIFSDGVHPGPAQIVATDDLTNLMVYLTQIQVYTETKTASGNWDGNWILQPITYNDNALWSVNVVSSTQVNFVLPNQQPVKIVYDALITLPHGQPGQIGNKISIFGTSDEDGRDDYVVSNITGGASADALRLRLFKQDLVNNINVPGAGFTLYITDLQRPGTPPYGITDPPLNVGGVDFFPLVANQVTNTFGLAIFDHQGINTTYEFMFLLVEDAIPDGYDPYPLNPTPFENYTFFTIKPNINQTLLDNAVNTINSSLPSGQISVDQDVTDFITINNIPAAGAPGSLRLWKLFTGIDITDPHYQQLLSSLQIVITDPLNVKHYFTLEQAMDPFGIVIEDAVRGPYMIQEFNAEIPGIYNLRTTPAVPFHPIVMPNMDREYVIQMNNIYTIPVIPLPPGVPNYPESLNVLKVVNGLTDEQIQQNLKNAVINITGPAGFNETVSLIDAINGVTFEDVPQGSYFFTEANANVNGFNLVTNPQVPFRRYILPTTSGAVTILITNEYTPSPPVGPAPQTGVNHSVLIPAIFVMLGGGCVAAAEVHRRRNRAKK